MTTHRKRLVLWCMSSAMKDGLAEGREEKAFLNYCIIYDVTIEELVEVLQMSVTEALGWKVSDG